jgi:hypothetical protein
VTSTRDDDQTAYTQPPTVFSVQPSSGPPGTLVSILGSGFSGAYSVQFGLQSTAPIGGADTLINVAAPPGEGTVTVTVTTPAGTSFGNSAAQFTYQS